MAGSWILLSGKRKKMIPKTMHPKRFIIKFVIISVFTFFPILNEAKHSGKHLPTFIPSSTGMATEKLIRPVAQTLWRIPTETDELCKTAVKAIPQRKSRKGFLKFSIIPEKNGESASGRKLTSICSIP